ncbi:MAG: replicative DNA helicase [Candidatus Cloacimonadota bacterium]|nr:MAG: replicative DNA helicase [Candidatus Cloacimonadota bacterium]RLC53841.1 MAG: replicative DNA helicase [Candidatus Cloacimonadota bacterium]
MANRTERQLPNDLNAEAAVLSAMMIDNYVVAKAIESLVEDNFYRKSHQIIFRNMSQLFEANKEIDIITLIDNLKTNTELEKVGGEAFLNELSDVVLSGANIDYHVNIVLEKALLRQLIQTSNKIVESSYNSDQPVEDIVDEAEQAIFRIAERPNRKAFQSIASVIPTTIENIEETALTKKNVLGVASGFMDLDRKIGGFRPGQLIILAARPAMGKTSLALNMASNMAIKFDKKVGIFTMEMEADELLMRMLSAASEVEMENMLKGYGMNEKKLLRIAGAAEVLAEKDIYIDDNGSNTILDIRAKTRRLKAELKGLDMIFIDYMQLMSVKRNRENRQQEISEISRSLKILAKELGLPIIALSQLNRGVESRDDKRPKLSDLRESGAIEQDADIVLFIYRDEVYYEEASEKPGIAELIIGKNRHGAIGKVELRFDAKFTAFRDLNQYD